MCVYVWPLWRNTVRLTRLKGGKEGALREERKWNRKCGGGGGGGGRRLVSVPLSPIPFPSLLPPLIPHLLSCSVSFPLCIFLPMIPYTWLPPPSLASLKELFPSPPPPLSRGHIFCSQVADVTKHWELAGTNLSLENIQFSLETLKSTKKKKIQEHLAILCPVPLSTVSVITGYL